jgi:hypothetical protein
MADEPAVAVACFAPCNFVPTDQPAVSIAACDPAPGAVGPTQQHPISISVHLSHWSASFLRLFDQAPMAVAVNKRLSV